MKILPNGQVEITNGDTGEKRVVSASELSNYGIEPADYEKAVKVTTLGSPVKTYNTPSAPATTYSAPALGPSTSNTAPTVTPSKPVVKTLSVTDKKDKLLKMGYSEAEVNRALGIQSVTNATPTKEKGLLEKAGDFLIPQTMDRYRKAFQTFDPNVSKEQKLKNYEELKSAKSTAKGALELGSYIVPAGKGIGGIMKAGAAMGAMRGASEGESFDSNAILGGAVGGAALGGIAGGVGKVLGGMRNKIGQSAVQNLGKGTPTMWQKAAEQHGVDLNSLIRKYFPKGADYDKVLGGITDRSKGGILGDVIKSAEAEIQATAKAAGTNVRIIPTDLITALKVEAQNIGRELGGGSRKAAIDKIIKETAKKYSKGITVNQAIKTLRYANEKFGKNIVEVNAGDAVATAAQKLEGNTLRSVLKSMFPNIAKALDTQSEVYTLRPVLSRARAILNTEGSAIRAGQMANVNLLNPLSWGNIVDVAMQNPKTASKWMNAGGLGSVSDAISKGSAVVGGVIGSKVGSALTPKESQNVGNTVNSGTDPYQSEQTQGNLNHDNSLTQNPQTVSYRTGKSPEYWNTQYQMAMRQSPPDELTAKYADDQFTKEVAYQKENVGAKPKALTGVQQVLVSNLESGNRAVDKVEELLSKDSNLLLTSGLPGIGSRLAGASTYNTARKEVADVIGRMRTGAVINDEEMATYLGKMPQLGDRPEDIQYKLTEMRRIFEAIRQRIENQSIGSNQTQYDGLGDINSAL